MAKNRNMSDEVMIGVPIFIVLGLAFLFVNFQSKLPFYLLPLTQNEINLVNWGIFVIVTIIFIYFITFLIKQRG